mmetsp:Transcript_7386/g.23275  ORF Transcript_7386/g.23275 Transcript_7386/m.23275 type:complete len:293 (-) Transcript_7386:222-1100(-)
MPEPSFSEMQSAKRKNPRQKRGRVDRGRRRRGDRGDAVGVRGVMYYVVRRGSDSARRARGTGRATRRRRLSSATDRIGPAARRRASSGAAASRRSSGERGRRPRSRRPPTAAAARAPRAGTCEVFFPWRSFAEADRGRAAGRRRGSRPRRPTRDLSVKTQVRRGRGYAPASRYVRATRGHAKLRPGASGSSSPQICTAHEIGRGGSRWRVASARSRSAARITLETPGGINALKRSRPTHATTFGLGPSAQRSQFNTTRAGVRKPKGAQDAASESTSSVSSAAAAVSRNFSRS